MVVSMARSELPPMSSRGREREGEVEAMHKSIKQKKNFLEDWRDSLVGKVIVAQT